MAAEPRLCTLHLGDDPSTWRAAGFDVQDEALSGPSIQLGAVRLQLHGSDGPRGLLRWDLLAPDPAVPTPGPVAPTHASDVDGLPTGWVSDEQGAPDTTHPNRVSTVDHVVVSSPDIERTVAALTARGFRERRRRTTGRYGEPMVQVFFWVGEVILELVGPIDVPTGTAGDPAAFFGLALTSTDLDSTADQLGELLGTPREAVQPGRLIATLRLERLGGSVPTVIMSRHPGGPASA